MDLERGIVIFQHNFKECCTDMKVVQHCAPLKIYIDYWHYSQVKDDGSHHVSRAPIFESRGLLWSPFHNFRSITEHFSEGTEMAF